MHLDACVQTEVAAPRQYSFKEGRGQVVCCLLAAHAMCQLPLDLDLTDGKQHHLLRLRGDLLLVYEGCTPTQVHLSGQAPAKYQYQTSLEFHFSARIFGILATHSSAWSSVLGPASSHICYNTIYRSRMWRCRHTMKWQTSLLGKAPCSQRSKSYKSLQQNWRRNFADPLRSSKDLFKVQHWPTKSNR